ncbi:hypothetical protein D3C75_939090 [compost metagenome]
MQVAPLRRADVPLLGTYYLLVRRLDRCAVVGVHLQAGVVRLQNIARHAVHHVATVVPGRIQLLDAHQTGVEQRVADVIPAQIGLGHGLDVVARGDRGGRANQGKQQ